jgi:tRNA pseudouridine-54 N-methylase
MDLNVPSSQNRTLIGTLSRAITNTIFLSHALRENIIIRIFVQKDVPHVFQIRSDSIRYLGPEERSFASICRKAERFFNERLAEGMNDQNWYEPNPGFFLRKSDNPFIDLDQLLSKPISILNLQTSTNKITLGNFEDLLQKSAKEISSLVIPLIIASQNDEIALNVLDMVPFEYQLIDAKLSLDYDIPKLVSITNLILDKNE